jgi:hypothetical protein
MTPAKVIRWIADGFANDARQVPKGETFDGGPLDGVSIFNVNMRTARKLRELADAVEDGRMKYPPAP